DIDPKYYFTEAARQDNKMLHRYFTRAKHQTALLKKHGARFDTVLDFGSGPGYFLHVCKAAQKFAFEPDQESRKYLEYLGATQYTDLADLPKDRFDVITASHSIEHLVAEELHSTLRCLLAALKPQGRLLIEVPQGGHSYLHLKGARQDPHTLFFTPQALVKAAKHAGAKILFRRTVGKPLIPRRQNPIYTPNPKNKFLNAAHGGLTVICTK
ncbi:class I SAM-dependent methyltransferase, partial [Profundibacter sp.]